MTFSYFGLVTVRHISTRASFSWFALVSSGRLLSIQHGLHPRLLRSPPNIAVDHVRSISIVIVCIITGNGSVLMCLTTYNG